MSQMNIPNLMTILRFVITPMVVLLLLVDQFWAGVMVAILITIAGISDFLDGYLARYWKIETDVGKLLDPVADKVLVLATLIMLINLDRVHAILVVIIVSREILITGMRAIASAKSLIIPALTMGKLKTTFQMIAAGALAFHETLFGINAHLLGLISLYISLFFSLYSAVQYIDLFLRELSLKMKV